MSAKRTLGRMRVPFAVSLAALALAILGNGCTATYMVGDKSFTSREAAEQEHARQVDETMMGIEPTTAPVGGRALLAIPSLDHIEQHAIKFYGNRAAISRDQIEYMKQCEMNGREAMFTALQRRQIFDAVTLDVNDDPQSTPISDYDFLIYLHNPSFESVQWYIKSGESDAEQPIMIDSGKPLGVPRTLSWLDSLEDLARPAHPASTVRDSD